jgi:hypothetical protein
MPYLLKIPPSPKSVMKQAFNNGLLEDIQYPNYSISNGGNDKD